MERVENLIRLLLAPGVGNATIRKLIRHFGCSERILGASEEEIQKTTNLRKPQLQGILKARDIDPRPELEKAADNNVTVIAYDDPAYPILMREAVFDPPSVLYVRGEIRYDDGNAFAIVGTRRASNYAREQARTFGTQLALAGFTVVSGLARGVDSFAHQGALEAKGRTIAVIGCGLLHMYPPENRDLAAEIALSGAVISEFPMDTTPAKENFPRRNRIIAGMSTGVLVVEAPERSGALITAHQAADMGRDVFAIPGRIDQPGASGCNKLLKDGAILVRDIDDILDEVKRPLLQGQKVPVMEQDDDCGRRSYPRKKRIADVGGPTGSTGAAGAKAGNGLPHAAILRGKVTPEESEAILLDLLEGDPVHIDELCRLSGLPVAEVSASLMVLELKRVIRQMPGKFFAKR